MKKLILVSLLFTFTVPFQIYAQEPISMRSMAAQQLFQYGQAVYERGDYSQAAIIFSKVLQFDPDYQEARAYAQKLNKKEEHVTIAPARIKKIIPTSDNDDLKKDIAEADQSINSLKIQISDLRNQIVQGHGDLPRNN